MENLAVIQKIGWDNATSQNPSLQFITSPEFAEFYDHIVTTPDKHRVFENWMGKHASFLEDRHWALTVFHPSVITNAIIEDHDLVVASEVRDSFCPGSIVYDGFRLRNITDPS